jgi:hypothetical protein
MSLRVVDSVEDLHESVPNNAPVVPVDGREDIIDVLTRRLAEAQRGEVLSIAVVAERPGGAVCTEYVRARAGNNIQLLGGVTLLQVRMSQDMNGGAP